MTGITKGRQKGKQVLSESTDSQFPMKLCNTRESRDGPILNSPYLKGKPITKRNKKEFKVGLYTLQNPLEVKDERLVEYIFEKRLEDSRFSLDILASMLNGDT